MGISLVTGEAWGPGPRSSRRLLPIDDALHLGRALLLTGPEGQGQVPGLIALQDVGFCQPGEDVLAQVQDEAVCP